MRSRMPLRGPFGLNMVGTVGCRSMSGMSVGCCSMSGMSASCRIMSGTSAGCCSMSGMSVCCCIMSGMSAGCCRMSVVDWILLVIIAYLLLIRFCWLIWHVCY
jgi:hypothetical protein